MLAVGARPEQEHLSYPRSELAERYGASAVETTTDPQEAYTRAGHDRPRHERAGLLGRAALVLSGS